jgi:hypothetical protein
VIQYLEVMVPVYSIKSPLGTQNVGTVHTWKRVVTIFVLFFIVSASGWV